MAWLSTWPMLRSLNMQCEDWTGSTPVNIGKLVLSVCTRSCRTFSVKRARAFERWREPLRMSSLETMMCEDPIFYDGPQLREHSALLSVASLIVEVVWCWNDEGRTREHSFLFLSCTVSAVTDPLNHKWRRPRVTCLDWSTAILGACWDFCTTRAHPQSLTRHKAISAHARKNTTIPVFVAM